MFLLSIVADVVVASVLFDLIVFIRASLSAEPHHAEMQNIISSFLLEHNIRKSPPGLISGKEEPCTLRRRMNVSDSNGFQILKKQKRKQGPLCRHKIGDNISPNT